MNRADWLRKSQRLLWIVVGVFIANAAWIMVGRYASVKVAPKRTVPVYTGYDTGPGVHILAFYASRGEVVAGENAVICYGVTNARGVRLEPPVETLKPALNRCIAISPQATTTYTLYATGDDGAQTSASFTVRVLPAPPHIEYVAISDKEVVRGEPVTVCAKIKNASEARLEPFGWKLGGEGNSCYKWYPAATMEYRVVAKGVGGEDREKFKIGVKPRPPRPKPAA